MEANENEAAEARAPSVLVPVPVPVPVAIPAAVRPTRTLVEYACAAAVSVLAAVVLLRLWRADLRVPFSYHDDALYFAMLVKSVVDHGWFLTNANLGAPGVLTMHDFPSADGLHLLAIKAMSWFSADWALLFNVYFLLGFPLITLSALAVLRHFRIAYGPALASSVLFAFLPRRLLLGEMHYFLDIFYQVPLAVLVALWVCGPDPPLFDRAVPRWWPRVGLRRGRALAAIAICLIVSATGIYYAFFAGVLMLLGGIWASINRRTPRNALAGLVLTGVIVAGLGVQAVPDLIYHHRHGPNPEIAARQQGEAEIYGMRIAQLLLPVPGHRLAPLRQIKRRYDAVAPFPGETSMVALGSVGSVGFLALLALVVLPRRRGRPRAELPRALATLNMFAVLVATTGGFGSLFALLVTPQVRAYARMQVFVAFLASFAVALLLDRAARARGRLAPLVAFLPIVVLVLGLLDQVAPSAIRPYGTLRDQYTSDAAFVRQIEAAVPTRGMILELPYQAFPEAETDADSKQQQVSYEPLRPYFHSTSLRWSYPAMRGRTADAWAKNVSTRPPAEMIQRLADAGFDGILIDRRHYLDHAADLADALGKALGAAPLVSDDERLYFFALTEHNRRALAGLSPEERERRRDVAVHPLFLRWLDGFYPPEPGPSGTFRWSAGAGKIGIDNEAGTARRARLTMSLSTTQPSTTLFIEGDLLSERVEISGTTGAAIERTFDVPAGSHVIRLQSTGPAPDLPGDPRELLWRINRATLDEVVLP